MKGVASRTSTARRLLLPMWVALMGLHVWSLGRFPGAFVDEAWFGSRAWSYLRSGNPLGTLDYGVVNRFHGARYFFQFLPMLGQAAGLWAAGGLSLQALRATSLLMGALLCIAVWCLARTWFDEATACWSVLLLALSGPFTYSSHLARYDMAGAAFGYAAIAVYVWPGQRRAVRAAFAGLLSGVAIECHPFALSIVVALPLLVVEEFRTRVAKEAVARYLAAGLCAGATIYPALHILPDPSSYALLTEVIYGPTHTPNLAQIGTLAGDSLRIVILGLGLLTPILIWSILTLGQGAGSSERRLFVTAAAIFGAFTVLVRNKLPYYGILLTPALTICVAVVVTRALWITERPSIVRFAGAVLVSVLVGGSCFVTVRALMQDGRPAFSDAVSQLAHVIRPGDRIMGSQTYWFGLSDHPYYSWEQLIYLQRLQPGLSATGALDVMHPDVFIRDDHMEWFILDSPGEETYARLLWLPKRELEAWLGEHSTVEADFMNPLYGRIRVYRIRWPGAALPTERLGR